MNYVRPKYSLILESFAIKALVDLRTASLRAVLHRVGAREHRDKVMVGMILGRLVRTRYVKTLGKGVF